MKPLIIILLFLYFMLNIPGALAQNVIVDRSLPSDPSALYITPVTLSGDMKEIFDAVFPNVKFSWHNDLRILGEGRGVVRATFNDSSYFMNDGFNIFLFDIENITGKKKAFTDEQLAKACVYFTYLQEEGRRNYVYNIENMKIIPADTIITFDPDRPYYYNDPRFFDKKPGMNYSAKVKFRPDYENSLFYWKEAVWYFNITDREIISAWSQIVSNTGKIRNSGIGYMKTVESLTPYDLQGHLEELKKIKMKGK